MTDSRTESTAVETPPGLGARSVDVPLVTGYTLLATAAILGAVVDGPVRLLVSVPLLLFLPGYALLTVLFPGRRLPSPKVHTARLGWSRGMGWGERMALSMAASLAVLVVLGVGLSAVGVRPSAATLAVALGVITIGWMAYGWYRRSRLPPDQRLAVPLPGWIGEVRDGTWGAPSRLDAALNVLLAVAIVVALSSLALGLVAPDRGEAYTEAALLTSSGGSLVAGNFSTDLRPGEPVTVTVTVENHERAAQTYTLVVRVERVRIGSDRTDVLEDQQLVVDRFEVADGSVRRAETTVRPTLVGRDLRLSYYLYLGDPPGTISAATADEHLFLWIDVRQDAERMTDESTVGSTPETE